MLVQYLVGLCALNWDPDAVDVVIGDFVEDVAAEKIRDLDVTVTVNASDGVHAFKGYEVKHEGETLDVSDIDGLVNKFKDMPSVTHRAIVSTSGFSDPAIKKAKFHDTELYIVKPWTRPLADQFPDLAPMSGPPDQHIGGGNYSLVWPVSDFWLGFNEQVPRFDIPSDGRLFDAKGRKHPVYSTFGEFSYVMVLRSTNILWPLEPILDRLEPLMAAHRSGVEPLPDEPQWPYAHTLDVTTDDVYIKDSDNNLRLVTTFTIHGELRWELQPILLCVMEKVPSGEAFAGALVAVSDVPGRMWALIFPAKGREVSSRWVQLERKHLNKIEKLSIALSADVQTSPTS